MPLTRLVAPSEWPTLGWQIIDWTEQYLCHGPGDIQGEPLVWDEEFCQIILDCYRIFPKGHEQEGRRVVSYFGISMPKGRAKSEFAGALVCAELLGPVRFDGWDANGDPVGKPVTYPFIRPLATEEGQTGNTYGNVQTMLEHARELFPSEWGFSQLDIGSTRTLIGKGGRLGEVRPSTAGAASKDGGKESFAVVDEPHLYYLPELRQMHAMVRRNTRKRKIAQPWMLATTTMFQPGQHSVAEDLYDEAEKLMEQQKRSFGFCWHHREGVMTESNWDDDVAQLASLKEAYGPAADWMDLAGMIEHEIRAPGSVKSENARYFHNLRWKGDQRAIDPEKWDLLAAPHLNPLGGEFIVIGFDGSDRGEHADDTVLVGWVLTEKPHLFLINAWKRPEFAGRDYRVPREEIREKVTELREQFEVRRFACDPPGWREEIDSWEKEFGERFGEPVVVEVLTNRPTRMGPAIDRFLEAIDEQSFTHDGSPELRDYALNALLTKSKGRSDLPAIVKPTIDAKIDGLVAAILSYDEVAKMPPEQPVVPFALLA
jgi:hypothetical protein